LKETHPTFFAMKQSTYPNLRYLLSFILTCLFVFPFFAQTGSVRIVINTQDDGDGSLRKLLNEVSAEGTLRFQSALGGDTIFLTSGPLLISKHVRIEGPKGAPVIISGSQSQQIMRIASGAEVSLQDLELVQGLTPAGEQGGAIFNQGKLELLRVRFAENRALAPSTSGSSDALGGAIANAGSLSARHGVFYRNEVRDVQGRMRGGALANLGDALLAYCQFEQNHATVGGYYSGGHSQGGAIYNEGTMEFSTCSFSYNKASGGSQLSSGAGSGGALYNIGYAKGVASTFSNNECAGDGFWGGAAFGGAIYNEDSLLLEQSTLSGNQTTGGGRSGGATGGGIHNKGYAHLWYCTLSQNKNLDSSPTAATGGGIDNWGELHLGGTLITDNETFAAGQVFPPGQDVYQPSYATAVSLGYNFIGVNTVLNFPATGGNLFGSPTVTADLQPLADNGGPTLTHALGPNSAVLNAGDPGLSLAWDQRGYPRTAHGRADMGAFESGPCQLWVTHTGDDGLGSLRHAMTYGQDGCSVGFANSLAGDTVRLSSGPISLKNKKIQVKGLGRDLTFISGDQKQPILLVEQLGRLSLQNLSLLEGQEFSIKNLWELEVYDCRIEKSHTGIINEAKALIKSTEVSDNRIKGGIHNTGYMDLIQSIVRGNTRNGDANCHLINSDPTFPYSYYLSCDGGPAFGGGIYNGGSLNILSSSIIHNEVRPGYAYYWKGPYCGEPESGYGGGIANFGTLNARHSTISYNKGFSGPEPVGGIHNAGTATFLFCTIGNNEAVASAYNPYCSFPLNLRVGGIENRGNLTLGSCILTENKINSQHSVDLANSPQSTLTSLGYNLVSDEGTYPKYNGAYEMQPATGDLVGGRETLPPPLAGIPIPALIDSLADNGGPTPTQALLPGSPALNAGDPQTAQPYEQRGYTRIANGRADIGAFESGASPIVRITDPVDGATLPMGASLLAEASVQAGQAPYLQVNCPDFSHRKLRIGNNSSSVWGPTVNVTTGGNHRLRISLRDPLGTIDWSKIRVFAQGVALGDYLPKESGTDWVTLEIPLADFGSAVDFSNLAFLEFPFSQKAGPFELHIRELSFVGGPHPYLWFGRDQLDNKHDGDGGASRMATALIGTATSSYVEQVSFSLDGVEQGFDPTEAYAFDYGSLGQGSYTLVATAHFSDGSCFSSEAVQLSLQPPQVSLRAPLEGSQFGSGTDIMLSAEVEGVVGPDYLKVICPNNKWRKLKLGHNPSSIWGPAVDVTAGGNSLLEVTLRAPAPPTNWQQIEIHPQGHSSAPARLGDYLPPQGIGNDWTSLRIPLADFSSAIDFTSLTYLEIPYSNAGGPFEIHLQDIRFTGGSTPFVWFGEDKTDNAHDGFGAIGQLQASLQEGGGNGQVSKLSFYANQQLLGEDSEAPYIIFWEQVAAGSYSLQAVATLNDGSSFASPPVSIQVGGPSREGQLTRSGELNVFPNPTHDLLSIQWQSEQSGQLKAQLFSPEGRLLKTAQWEHLGAQSHHRLNLSGLAQGWYLLRFESEAEGVIQNLKVIRF
jgi:hypothetical protein